MNNIADIVVIRHHRNRAKQFLEGMKRFETELDKYGNNAALLAVHSAISLNDVILLWYTGCRSKSQNHADAASALRAICKQQRKDSDGCKHLEWLLAKKHKISYDDEWLDVEKDLKKAIEKAERFDAWIAKYFSEAVRENGE